MANVPHGPVGKVPYIVYDARPAVDSIRLAFSSGVLELSPDRKDGFPSPLDNFIDVWLDYQMMETHWVSLENLEAVMSASPTMLKMLHHPSLDYALDCFHRMLFIPPHLTGSSIVTRRVGGGYYVFFK